MSRSFTSYVASLTAGASALALASSALAAEAAAPPAKAGDAAEVEEVVVNGLQFTGQATPMALTTSAAGDIAAVTVLSGEDVSRQTLATNVDIFRSVPGVQVGDFGQVGIAQGVSFRGWPGANDSSAVAFYIDGMQRNEPSGSGANGYLDINPMIPEVLEDVTVVKGPFNTRYGGNFALAGAFIATTADHKPTSLALTGGSYGLFRGVGVLGRQTDAYSVYTAVRYLREDGYQANADQEQLTTFTKLTLPTDVGQFAFSLQTFNLKHGSPGYLDYLDVKSGAVSRRAAVNLTDGGAKDQYTFISAYKAGDAVQGVEASAYADTHSRHRFATFTPLPQQNTANRRNVYGFNIDPHWSFRLGDLFDGILSGGVSARHDDVDFERQPSINGVAIETPNPIMTNGYQRAAISQTQAGVYGNVTLKHRDWLKVMLGLRYDRIEYNIQNQSYVAATNSFAQRQINASTEQLSPKIGIAFQPTPELTIFANYGRSFSSPDGGREVVSNPLLNSPTLTTKEVGVTYNGFGGRLHVQVSAYDTVNTDEFVVSAGIVSNAGTSKRKGYDIESSALVYDGGAVRVKAYGNYSKIDAALASGNPIPAVADWVASYGIHADYTPGGGANVWQLDVGQQWTGPQGLNAFNTAFRSKTYSRVTAKLSYEMPEANNLRLWAETTVYPGSTFDEFGFVIAGRRYVTSQTPVRISVGVSREF